MPVQHAVVMGHVEPTEGVSAKVDMQEICAMFAKQIILE